MPLYFLFDELFYFYKLQYSFILGNNVSINIEVDPRHPSMLPEYCFLGADHGMRSHI